MSRTAIRCNCGQRVVQKDVMQTGYYPRMAGASFVCVRYRCSRCKKLGEQFVKQQEWESGILRETTTEANPDERKKFADLGPIKVSEMADFHDALENDYDLGTLNAEFAPGADGDGGDKRKPE